MSHEITIRDNGRAEMAFAGATPWHGLGQSVTKGASLGVWLKEAGMDWMAMEAGVEAVLGGDPCHNVRFPDHKALYRSNTMAPLAIVGKNYKVVQPRQILEFFRSMVEHEGWHIHTAGTLRGGRKLWVMATNGQRATVGKGDPVVRNVVLATSLDGTMRTVAMDTAVRVVCANTLSMALQEDRVLAAMSHRTEFDATLFRRAIGAKEYAFESFIEQARALAETPMDLTQARDYLYSVFVEGGKKSAGATPDKASSLSWLSDYPEDYDNPRQPRSVSRCLELFEGVARGSNKAQCRGTAWGLFNAVTEYVDHEMGRDRDTGYDSALFGRGSHIKREAMTRLVIATS